MKQIGTLVAYLLFNSSILEQNQVQAIQIKAQEQTVLWIQDNKPEIKTAQVPVKPVEAPKQVLAVKPIEALKAPVPAPVLAPVPVTPPATLATPATPVVVQATPAKPAESLSALDKKIATLAQKSEQKDKSNKKENKEESASESDSGSESEEDDSMVQDSKSPFVSTKQTPLQIAQQKVALEQKKETEAKEAAAIQAKAMEGIKALEGEDASLSDMKSFLKQTMAEKTSADLEKEEKEMIEKKKLEAIEAEKEKQLKLEESMKKTDSEIEEERLEQEKLDKTKRHEDAMMYAQQMAEDDARDGSGGDSHSNFSVIVDQKAEQDYATNVFRGSGNMSEIFDAKPEDAAKDKAEKVQKKKILAQKKAEKEANTFTADKGEALITSSDPENMYEFSTALAAKAGE